MNDAALAAACTALAAGGIVAYPTEAVYGLGCDPSNATAIERLLTLKNRPPDRGLILIAARLDALGDWVRPLDEETRARIEPTWPGPVTWLLPASDHCPALVRGTHGTVAVRITAHPIAAALCNAWRGPLVSTSANRSGEPPARDAETVRRQFGDSLAAIVEGPVGPMRRPTPIRDAGTGRTLRE